MPRTKTLSRSPARTVLSLSAFAAIIDGGLLYAGPLDPPVGPVAPTYKTLTEVEPRIAINAANTPGDADSVFRITQPGSYYLTENITAGEGFHGIEVDAYGVRIDLMGFRLSGVPSSLVERSAIFAIEPAVGALRVVNGFVASWSGDGINIGGQGSTVEDITVIGCLVGIRVDQHSRIERCAAIQNRSRGIVTGLTCSVFDSIASSCNGNGFDLARYSTASRCKAVGNSGTGLVASDNCTVSDCVASANSMRGFSLGGESHADNCRADRNGSGIVAGTYVSLSRCATFTNTGTGIEAAAGAAILDCTSSNNGQAGISVLSDSLARGNTCDENGTATNTGANILVVGQNNRIEANQCSDADRGIEAQASRNFIARNTCTANGSNYVIVIGNIFLAVNAATNGAAVNGSAGGTAPGSTDPNANFSY